MDRRSQINKYLAGELEVEEANELLEWINSPDGQVFLAEEAEEIWNQGTHEKNDFGWDGEKLWQKIRDASIMSAVQAFSNGWNG